MTMRMTHVMAGVTLMSGLIGVALDPAAAQTVRQQCTAKYQAAKAANTLNGMSYNQFYSACSKEAKGEAVATPAAAAPAATAAPVAPANPLKPAAPATTTAAAPSAVAPAPTAPAASGNAVFPTAISPKYSSEKAGVARRKTCDDQYTANKATGGNGGLKWIQKGGGYYSECNKRLKA